jgi:hypothetical protein
MLFDTLRPQTHTQTLLLSSVENQLIRQIVNDLKRHCLQPFHVEVLDALVIMEFSSWELFVADLAHDKNFWAVSLDMVMELGSSHVLELGSVADITSELGAVELSMCLELTEGLPDDNFPSILIASMWEFTEINAVLQHLVNFLEEITASLAIGAANIEPCSLSDNSIRRHLTTHWTRFSSSSISTGRHQFVVDFLPEIIPLHWILGILHFRDLCASTFLKLELAILTEKFVAVFALERFEWELEAHDALDLFHHFALKLILDFIHLNIKRRNWLWTHHSLDSLIRNNKILSCINRKIFLFGVHFLEDGLTSPLLLVHLNDRHLLSQNM